MAGIRLSALLIAALVPFGSSAQAQSQDENVDPAPSGREQTDTTVYPDGISISMPGKDADTPSSNPVDWSSWDPGHDDDTSVTFDPGTSDPPSEPDPEPASEPDSEPESEPEPDSDPGSN